MRIKSEDEILKLDVRKKIIEEINSTENIRRKEKFFKFYQCYKDNTKEYVLRLLRNQFDADTVNEMAYSITNLGFARKIVDKLARVYNNGVEREVYLDGSEEIDEALTEQIQEITKELDINRFFKKTNRWLKRDKNCVQYITPRKVGFDSNDEKFTIKPIVLPAYLYDVVELDDNREIAGCYILSDFAPRHSKNMYYTTGDASVRIRQPDENGNYPYSDNKDNLIADNPRDQQNEEGNYVFWSDNYHFTCNAKGVIIDENGNPSDAQPNPIGVKPFVNYAEDQDNSFWAQGGDDLIDGAISINTMITNIIHIAITQGYGQPIMSGPNPPRALKLGPNKVILLEQKNTDEPKPEFRFETANPPLAELRQLVEFYVALLLTTNNLSTSGVSTTLGSAAAFPSGIAMMIDKAESMEDIEDQAQIFTDNEPKFWDIFAKWHSVLKASKELDESLEKYEFPDKFKVCVHYNKPQPIQSEKERLDILKQKKDLGIISMLDILREEYPDLTDEQLQQKLAEIAEEQAQRVAQAQMAMGNEQGLNPDQQGQESEGTEDAEESNGASAEETSSEEEGQITNDDQGD